MKILSIDWDYFFPSEHGYDWGHRESPMFIDFLWQTRVDNRNMLTGAPLIEEFNPTVPVDFWSIVTNKPVKLYITESHCHMFSFMGGNGNVTCLDAHHDFCYGDGDKSLKEIHAGNWAWAARKCNVMKRYYLHYPEYRKEIPEALPKTGITRVSYELPKPAAYDVIHICRSGAWTPPWYDDQFSKLVAGCPARTHETHGELKVRSLTMETALVARKTMAEHMEKYNCARVKTLSISAEQFSTVNSEIAV